MVKRKKIFEGLKDFDVKKSKNGFGIVAKKNFLAGDILFEIKGKIISCDVGDGLDEETRSNTFRFDEEKYLSPKGEIADFLNHSCEPNSGVIKKNKKLFLVAILDIKKGEEIVFDYSTIIASDDIWKMKCSCGADNCRKIIKKFNTIPKKIKDKYINLGIVPEHILD